MIKKVSDGPSGIGRTGGASGKGPSAPQPFGWSPKEIHCRLQTYTLYAKLRLYAHAYIGILIRIYSVFHTYDYTYIRILIRITEKKIPIIFFLTLFLVIILAESLNSLSHTYTYTYIRILIRIPEQKTPRIFFLTLF